MASRILWAAAAGAAGALAAHFFVRRWRRFQPGMWSCDNLSVCTLACPFACSARFARLCKLADAKRGTCVRGFVALYSRSTGIPLDSAAPRLETRRQAARAVRLSPALRPSSSARPRPAAAPPHCRICQRLASLMLSLCRYAGQHKVIIPSELKSAYFLMISAYVPRPIALVSSISASGVGNVAPYSYSGCVAHDPPTLVVSCCRRPDGRCVRA